MPQLKKVVLAIGNTLIYRDTYEQGLAELSALMQGGVADIAELPVATPSPSSAVSAPALDRLRELVQSHLRRARELAGQGKWAEAGKELDAIEAASRSSHW